jgi:hypothetical protein
MVITPIRSHGLAILLASALAFTVVMSVVNVAVAGSDPVSGRTASAGCTSVIFIGAAGSGELEQDQDPAAYDYMGPEINKMAEVIEGALAPHNLSLTKAPDKYPADSVNDLNPFSDLGSLLLRDSWPARIAKYFASIDTGIANAESEAKADVRKCPSSHLILAGYSQGAIVMHQAELRLANNQAVMGHIAGTLLLGDGDRAPDSAAKLFGATAPDEPMNALRSDEGIRAYFKLPKPRDVPLPATTAEICSADDIICDFKAAHDNTPHRIKKAIKVHTSYAIKDKQGRAMSYSPLLASAASWLAAKIIATDTPAPPPPPPPAPTPPPPPAPPVPPANEEAGVVSFPGSPLTVSVGQLGQCQSSYEGTGDNYFPPDSNVGDCGFFLAFPAAGAGQPPALYDTTWGFDGAAGPHGLNLYTPVSQSSVTGSGTEADPYTQVTVFKVLDSEEREDALVTETTTYVDGATQFTSTYDVKNTATGPIYFRAIYAGDLYVGGNDFGSGVFEAGPPRFVGGQNAEDGAIGGFLEAGEPPWTSFEEGCWNDTEEEDNAEAQGRCTGAEPSDDGIWHTVETTTEEPRAFNESTEPANVDNAVGVEWDQLREAGLPAGQEQAFKIVNVYRP